MKNCVKIIDCKSRNLWYFNLIGECFTVENRGDDYYLTSCGKTILRKDCIELIDPAQYFNPAEVKYAKLVVDHIAYYIDECHLEYVGKKLKEFPTSRMTLIMHSNFVVDLKENKILKCRWSVQDIIDKYTGV